MGDWTQVSHHRHEHQSKQGNHMSSKGLFAKDKEPKLVPTPTKKGVSRILDWIYKPPETRGKNTKESDPF